MSDIWFEPGDVLGHWNAETNTFEKVVIVEIIRQDWVSFRKVDNVKGRVAIDGACSPDSFSILGWVNRDRDKNTMVRGFQA